MASENKHITSVQNNAHAALLGEVWIGATKWLGGYQVRGIPAASGTA
jgi:hypothetical protein